MNTKQKYYSSRHGRKSFKEKDLYDFFKNLYAFFMTKDYFKEKLEITSNNLSDSAIYEAAMELKFPLFPINKWDLLQITEDNIFDSIEYFYNRISKPGEMDNFTSSTGWNYSDYVSYNSDLGKMEYREYVNRFLADYKTGYELSIDGLIELIGENGLDTIFQAEIVPYDHNNVDSKVLDAIKKWRNRHFDIKDRKQAILNLADVFEWLKKTGKLEKALNKKDESAIFEIANSFALRHHNPNQKSNYDINIWYSWIFHFYLATYHAAIRIIKRLEEDEDY
jgi:hypothetical protein